jgi:two-component system, chemotaxis family, CheB/CheR fusion protein
MATTQSKATILCIDDEALGLYFRKLILEGQGYQVLTANSAAEGLEQFIRNQVDLVVTDHLLGRGTGTAMAAEMRRVRPNVPIIILSGTTDLPQGLENADVFLSKTEGPEKLLAEVEKLLARARAEPQARVALPKTPSSDPDAVGVQALFAAIVEGSDDAIFSKTLNGIVTSWNRAAERMYGYKAEEMIGQPVSILLPPDRPNEVKQILERLRRGERLEHFETTRVAKDGRRLQVSLTISPVRGGKGDIVGASTIARDVTQTKMAEQALRNSEKLAVAGRMAATVAHEINGPLEAVSNILYLLEKSSTLDETARGYVQAAQKELKNISQIAKATLGFYRNLECRPAPVNIVDLIENVITLNARKIERLGITLEKRYTGRGTVVGDQGELRQVFSNLILNAVEALAKSGTRLRIRVFDALDWENSERRGVRAVISENGPGVALVDRSRLFEPFYSTKGDAGTGVGLWVSRGIVEKHGGSITFRSRITPEFTGTAFSVFLPLDSSAAVSA